MDEDKIAEYADWFIDDGFEPEQAWKVARLMVKPQEERTDEENDLISQAVKQFQNNTLKLRQGYAYVGKLESELYIKDIKDCFNGILSGVEGLLQENYRKARSPCGDTEEGIAKWPAELEQRSRIEEQLRQILENME